MTWTWRSTELHRYIWAAGIVFVVALLAETIVGSGFGVTHEDSATEIANAMAAHRGRLLAIAYLSTIYAPMFVIYLWKLYDLLREGADRRPALGSLVVLGGVLFVTLHAVSDIGITGLMGAKIASFGAEHDPGVTYSLYLLTYAIDSVGDVFASLFMLAAGLLIFEMRALPRWLGWMAIVAAVTLFLQGFGLGGVISVAGLVLDLIGFALVLIFVLASSIIMLRRPTTPAGPAI